MCGRLARNKNRPSDSATPMTRPLSTPSTRVAINVAIKALKSSLEKRQVERKMGRSIKDNTATMMVAASVACGK